MTEIKPGSIVVATDGSVDAERAVAWAAAQAALEGRPLVVASAARPIPAFVGAGPGAAYVAYPPTDALAGGLAVAEGAAALAKRSRPGIVVSSVAGLGDPREFLIGLSTDAHLLVLGSRGRGPVTSKLLGSVSAAVSKHAACPTVVCRPAAEGVANHGIAVAADGTPESLPVIEFAFRQAALRARPLTVIHCFWDDDASPWEAREVSTAGVAAVEQHLLLAESIAGFRAQYPDVEVTTTTVRGSTEKYLASLDVHDLVVVGRHPVDSLARRVSHVVSTVVLERVHTDVAVVPEAAPRPADHS